MFYIFFSFGFVGVVFVVFDFVGNGIGDKGFLFNIILFLRNSDVDFIGDYFNFRILEFLFDLMGEKSIIGSVLDVYNIFFGVSRGFNNGDVFVGKNSVDIRLVFFREVGKLDDVDFVNDEDGGFILEKGFDRLEEFVL